jgi:hemerythrin-like domain-containing protein
MQRSKPMQMLVEEHEVISSVLDSTEFMLAREDAEFPQAFLENAFDFFVSFADKWHHAKEEAHLFPLMVSRGVPHEGGPIGCMLREHEEGRAHVAAVRAALKLAAGGDLAARQTARREAAAFVALLRQHIFKENNVCFPLGDHAMTDQDKDDVWRKFLDTERTVFPPGAHEKYVALAKELADSCLTPTTV